MGTVRHAAASREDVVPLEFLKRRGGGPQPSGAGARPGGAPGLPEEVVAESFQLKLQYTGKSTEGVRISAGPQALAGLTGMLVGVAKSEIELVEPLSMQYAKATPQIVRPGEAMQWLNANHALSPITRHGLYILELVDAIDMAFDTFACALLDGELDVAGYPDYAAIVGGVASHWDEATGDMIVRGVVGWGGRGSRGDTDKTAARLLGEILQNVFADRSAMGVAAVDRPVPAAGQGGLVCAHCGFASGHLRAFYCPKCGMRLLRG
jgi:hypothetical protein